MDCGYQYHSSVIMLQQQHTLAIANAVPAAATPAVTTVAIPVAGGAGSGCFGLGGGVGGQDQTNGHQCPCPMGFQREMLPIVNRLNGAVEAIYYQGDAFGPNGSGSSNGLGGCGGQDSGHLHRFVFSCVVPCVQPQPPPPEASGVTIGVKVKPDPDQSQTKGKGKGGRRRGQSSSPQKQSQSQGQLCLEEVEEIKIKEEVETSPGPPVPEGYSHETWILQEGLHKVRKQRIQNPGNEDKLPFFCPVCLKQYKNANGIKYHARYAHGPKRNYTCEVCQRNYATRHGLTAHKKTHKNDVVNVNLFNISDDQDRDEDRFEQDQDLNGSLTPTSVNLTSTSPTTAAASASSSSSAELESAALTISSAGTVTLERVDARKQKLAPFREENVNFSLNIVSI